MFRKVKAKSISCIDICLCLSCLYKFRFITQPQNNQHLHSIFRICKVFSGIDRPKTLKGGIK